MLPSVYAHRFGGHYGPESSRAALERSLEGEVGGVEVDVVLTADDDVVAVHDPFLRVATDLDGWAHRTSTATVLRARLLDGAGEPSDQRPLSLEEVLCLLPPGLPLQLDVKAYADPELARQTAQRCCEVAIAHGTADRVEVISFFTEACAAAVAAGVAARLVIWADYSPPTLARWVAGQGFVGVSVEGFIFSERLRAPLAEAGLSISVGAVNSAEQLELLLPLEPDTIVSDRPLELRGEVEALAG